MKDIYKRVSLNTEDLRNMSLVSQSKNAAGSIYVNGKTHSIGVDYAGCCQFEHFVLNSQCKAKVSIFTNVQLVLTLQVFLNP